MSEKKIPIPESLSESQLAVQPERLPIRNRPQRLTVGIPKEVTLQERRIALVPSGIQNLVANGHRVLVEKDAGKGANFSDRDFSEAGAEVVYSAEEVFKSQVLLKVAPPTLDEIKMMQPDQVLISPLQLPIISADYINALKKKRITALAMEYIQDESGKFPIVRMMSEMAGVSAMLTAADLLATTSGGKGVLLGAVSGVPSAKVVILGAGVVAEFATRTALGLGAEVRIFSNNMTKLKRLQTKVGRRLYTSAINPHYLEQELLTAEVAIGAIHAKTGRTPMVVPERMVEKMKDGSVIIDVSIDQGGCFETSELTSLKHPTFTKHGVIHYCVPNMVSKISRTASIAVSNVLAPILVDAGRIATIEQLLFSNHGLRHGVYTYKGCLTNEYLGRRFAIKSMDLDLLITSNL